MRRMRRVMMIWGNHYPYMDISLTIILCNSNHHVLNVLFVVWNSYHGLKGAVGLRDYWIIQ